MSVNLEALALQERDFDRLLLEAVDEGLATLGESSRQAIYFHLERNFHIKKEEIPSKIEVFVAAIEKIFGLGANFIEILIMKKLYEKLGRSFKWRARENFTFAEYVSVARRSFLKSKGAEKTTEGLVHCEKMAMES